MLAANRMKSAPLTDGVRTLPDRIRSSWHRLSGLVHALKAPAPRPIHYGRKNKFVPTAVFRLVFRFVAIISKRTMMEISEKRRQSILDIAREFGVVTVDALILRFQVTPQTIRKDLNRLCDERLLTRTHGGARLASSVENMSYEARRMLAWDQKQAIGQAVAKLIPDNASLFVNIGTTTEAVAQALLQHRQLLVITNNINVASLMRPYPENKVIIASGEVRSSDGGIIGESAVDFIKQFKVDFAVVGASAIDEDGALLDYDYREVKVSQAILSNARHVIVAADSTKHERRAPVRIAHISQTHSFVTDRCPNPAFRRLLSGFEVRTIETSAERQSS